MLCGSKDCFCFIYVDSKGDVCGSKDCFCNVMSQMGHNQLDSCRRFAWRGLDSCCCWTLRFVGPIHSASAANGFLELVSRCAAVACLLHLESVADVDVALCSGTLNRHRIQTVNEFTNLSHATRFIKLS